MSHPSRKIIMARRSPTIINAIVTTSSSNDPWNHDNLRDLWVKLLQSLYWLACEYSSLKYTIFARFQRWKCETRLGFTNMFILVHYHLLRLRLACIAVPGVFT